MATLAAARTAIRELLAVGINEGRVGREEWIRAVREQVKADARAASPRSPRGRSGLTRVSDGLEEYLAERRAILAARGVDLTAPDDRPPTRCPVCEDARAVNIGTREAHSMVPCPSCVSIEDRLVWAGVDRRFLAASLEAFEALPGKVAARGAIEAWDTAESVVMTGEPGRGKTHLAAAMLARVISRKACAWRSVPDLLESMRQAIGKDETGGPQAIADRVAVVPVLVLDDLGAEQSSPWSVEQLRLLVDRRYRRELTTVVTTNLDYAEVERRYGQAVASRIGSWRWIEIGGVDYRPIEAAKRRTSA